MSWHYPLTEYLVEKYRDLWFWIGMSCNESLPWSMDFFTKYDDKWDWGDSDRDSEEKFINNNKALPWSAEFIDRYKDKVQWAMISEDAGLFKFTPELIERFKDRWNWENLSDNKALPWIPGLIKKYENKWDWYKLARNEKIIWTDDLINTYSRRFDVDTLIGLRQGFPKEYYYWESDPDDPLDPGNNQKGLMTPGEFSQVLKKPDWRVMSFNTRIPWSIALIDYYRENWNWEHLSLNESLPWSMELLEKFENYWEWGSMQPAKWDPTILEQVQGLSYNKALPWSETLIDKFIDRWDWTDISRNEGMHWSLKLIKRYEDKWHWEVLTGHEPMWDQVFDPYIDDDFIVKIMDGIIGS